MTLPVTAPSRASEQPGRSWRTWQEVFPGAEGYIIEYERRSEVGQQKECLSEADFGLQAIDREGGRNGTSREGSHLVRRVARVGLQRNATLMIRGNELPASLVLPGRLFFDVALS